MKNTAYVEHREELKAALEKAIYQGLTKLGDKAKQLDWFAGNATVKQDRQAA